LSGLKYGTGFPLLDGGNGDTVDNIHFRDNAGKLEYSTDGSTWVSAGLDTSDATAVAAQILSGITAYVNGTKITGTMIDRSGDTTAVSSSLVGTTLKLLASTGYRDGINDFVTITDANHISANIKSGVTNLGVTGTYTDTANAPTAGQILTGKVIFANGQEITGTMPNRSGDTAAIASSISGTTLKLRASSGYRDGTDDNVTITDVNFIASNLLANMFGMTATGLGFKSASGITTSASSTTSYTLDTGSTIDLYAVTISGLNFTPVAIAIWESANAQECSTFYMAEANFGNYSDNNLEVQSNNTAYIDFLDSIRVTGNASVSAGTFNLPVQHPSLSVKWKAIGY
jgi:hypothetical protein